MNYYNFYDFRDISPYLGYNFTSLHYFENLLSYSIRILLNSFLFYSIINFILLDKSIESWRNNIKISLALLISLSLLFKILYTGYNIYFNATAFLSIVYLIVKFMRLSILFMWIVRVLIFCFIILIVLIPILQTFESEYILRTLTIIITTLMCCFVSFNLSKRFNIYLKSKTISLLEGKN